jgi:hypothetical protein
MPPRGVLTVSNHDSLFSSETQIYPGTKKNWREHLISSNERQEAIGGLLFSNKWKVATLQPTVWKIDDFKPRSTSSDISSGGSIFRVEDQNFLIQGAKTQQLSNATGDVASKLANCCFRLHMYGLCAAPYCMRLSSSRRHLRITKNLSWLKFCTHLQ